MERSPLRGKSRGIYKALAECRVRSLGRWLGRKRKGQFKVEARKEKNTNLSRILTVVLENITVDRMGETHLVITGKRKKYFHPLADY